MPEPRREEALIVSLCFQFLGCFFFLRATSPVGLRQLKCLMSGPRLKLVVTTTYLPPQRRFFPAHRSPMPLLLRIFLCSPLTHVGISKPLCAGPCRRWSYRSWVQPQPTSWISRFRLLGHLYMNNFRSCAIFSHRRSARMGPLWCTCHIRGGWQEYLPPPSLPLWPAADDNDSSRKVQGPDCGPVVSFCLRAWCRSYQFNIPAFAPHRTA